MKDREALQYLFDHHARLCKRANGTYYVDFGESFIEIPNTNMKHLKRVAEKHKADTEGDVLDDLVRKQEPWDALSRLAGTKIV